MAVGTVRDVSPEAVASDPDLLLFTQARDRELRGRDRLFLVESPRVVRRFLRNGWRNGWRCRALLTTPEHFASLRPLLDTLDERVTIYLADERTLSATSGYRLHGGALALGERNHWPPSTDALLARLPEDGPLTLVVAQSVVQMDNIGALFRNAACFGAAGILLDDACADPLLRKTIRFSMGRVFDVPWGVSLDLEADLTRLRDLGIEPLALELTPTARPVAELPAGGRAALVVGSETYGITPPILARCAATFAIPSAGPDEDGEARSLNVGVAAAIALHQRTAAPG